MSPRTRKATRSAEAASAGPESAVAAPAAAGEVFTYVQRVGRAFPGLPAAAGPGTAAEAAARAHGWTPIGEPVIENRADGDDDEHELVTWAVPVKASVA